MEEGDGREREGVVTAREGSSRWGRRMSGRRRGEQEEEEGIQQVAVRVVVIADVCLLLILFFYSSKPVLRIKEAYKYTTAYKYAIQEYR